jgi:hypothetical protein
MSYEAYRRLRGLRAARNERASEHRRSALGQRASGLTPERAMTRIEGREPVAGESAAAAIRAERRAAGLD